MAAQEKTPAESVAYFGSYRLDLESAQLWRGTQAVKVTGKAFGVLQYFVAHPGQLVTKDDLFGAVWPETVVTESTLASCIQELRQALRDDAKKPHYIETVHRRGYRFLSTLTTQPVQSSKFQVPSQEEEASSQSSVGSSQQEESQQATGNTTGQAEGWRLEASGSPRFSPPTRFWSSKIFMLVAIVLLSGTVLTV